MTTPHPPSEHFGGKSVPEHLKEARARGAMASAEIHGVEMPGDMAAAADSAKEMAIALLILWILSLFFPVSLVFFLIFCCGWTLWKTARSALLGWSRMERLHRVIEEERWEIEHHRAQEREELMEMYRAKGLTGKLLDEVTDVFMADDNRLLRLMLQEELGLTLEAYEHPLKQAFGAFSGSGLSAALCLSGLWILPRFGLPISVFILIFAATYISTKIERNTFWSHLVWNTCVAGCLAGVTYFLIPLLAPRS